MGEEMKKFREFVIWPDDKQPAQTEWSGLRLFNNPDGYKLSNGDVRVIEHSAITELESQLKLAVECIEFYADKGNWSHGGMPSCINNEKDHELIEFDGEKIHCGGKLARETLKKLTGEKE